MVVFVFADVDGSLFEIWGGRNARIGFWETTVEVVKR